MKPRRWTDHDLWTLMKLHEVHQLPFSRIAERMGRTRNACSGQYKRIVDDMKRSEV